MSNDQSVGHADGQGKLVTIIVNGTQQEVEKGDLTFAQIVALASGLPTGPNILYTITVRKADGKPDGTVVEGASVKVKDGTVFNVTATDKS